MERNVRARVEETNCQSGDMFWKVSEIFSFHGPPNHKFYSTHVKFVVVPLMLILTMCLAKQQDWRCLTSAPLSKESNSDLAHRVQYKSKTGETEATHFLTRSKIHIFDPRKKLKWSACTAKPCSFDGEEISAIGVLLFVWEAFVRGVRRGQIQTFLRPSQSQKGPSPWRPLA